MIDLAKFQAAIPLLSPKDQAFANSLMNAQTRWSRLSPKQEHWAQVLTDRAFAPKQATQTATLDVSGMTTMFGKAKSAGLRYPKIRVQVDGTELRFSLAQVTSRNAGYIYVKVNGEYAGKISPAGQYSGNQTALATIAKFANDPLGCATAHGHLTGNCCFCGRELTDSRSTAMGYGPVCAAHYGLAWGEQRSPEVAVSISTDLNDDLPF